MESREVIRRLLLLFLIAAASAVHAQSALQLVGDGGYANADTWYGAAAGQFFFRTGVFHWTLSGSYVDATTTGDPLVRAFDTTIAAVAVRESLVTRTIARSRRAAFGLACDFPVRRIHVGLFGIVMREQGDYTFSASYYFALPPNPYAFDTAFVPVTSTFTTFLVGGAEADAPLGASRAGLGALGLADMTNGGRVYGQAWGRFTTNQARLVSLDAAAGVVSDSALRPFVEAALRWQISPSFALRPSIIYSGTEYFYDVLAHYQNFYHELNAAHVTVMGILDAGYGAKLFANISAEHNDRFLMYGLTLGTYVVL